jgi:DNA-3-methyladenine glycosylase
LLPSDEGNAAPPSGPEAQSKHKETFLIEREFFVRPAVEVAPEVLGCVLEHQTPDGVVAVRLTEVEAYMGAIDPAAHSYRGRTARNAVMFGPPGHAYVYFTYGMHYCANLVCSPPGEPTAVLLRAGEIVGGVALARARRNGPNRARALRDLDLARGPARLCQALEIDLSHDGLDVCDPGSPLRVFGPAAAVPAASISTGPRVGISQAAEVAWRYWITGDRTVSAYRPAVPRRATAKPVTGPVPRDGTMPE